MSLRFSCDKKYISSEKVPQCLTAKWWKPMEGRYAVQFSVLSACGNEFQGISEYRKSFIVGLVLHKVWGDFNSMEKILNFCWTQSTFKKINTLLEAICFGVLYYQSSCSWLV